MLSLSLSFFFGEKSGRAMEVKEAQNSISQLYFDFFALHEEQRDAFVDGLFLRPRVRGSSEAFVTIIMREGHWRFVRALAKQTDTCPRGLQPPDVYDVIVMIRSRIALRDQARCSKADSYRTPK